MPLQLLPMSSNELTQLPDSLVECTALTHIYANSNQLTTLPAGNETLGLEHQLERLNLNHSHLNRFAHSEGYYLLAQGSAELLQDSLK